MLFCVATQLKSFCVKDCSVELLAFWMDIEHFRQLRRTNAELIAFGHQISTSLAHMVWAVGGL